MIWLLVGSSILVLGILGFMAWHARILDLALVMLLLKALIAVTWAINYWVIQWCGYSNDYRPAGVITIGLGLLWLFGAGIIVTCFVEKYNAR